MVTGQQPMESKTSNNTPNNQLSILIRQDGFSFLVESSKTHKEDIHHFKLKPKEINKVEALLDLIKSEINKDFINEFNIKTAKIIYHHSLFTLAPSKYFSTDSASDFIKYNAKILPEDQLVSEEIKTVQATITYIPYTNINNYFIDLLGSFQYQHHLESLIKINFELDNERERVLVFVDQNVMSISAFIGKKLILANSFQFNTEEDLAYYILFCIQQIEFNRENMILLLFGCIKKTNLAYKYLFNYIKHVDFLFSFIDFNYPEVELKSYQLLFEENYAHSLRKI